MPALLTSLQSVWLNQPPQASSDYLSVQLGCSAAQGNLCYVNNNHTCSTTSTPGERDSSPPEQEGLILSKTEIDLPPTTSAAKKHSRPSATAAAATKEAEVRALQQLRATSEDHKVHSVEKSPKPSCKLPEGSEEKNPRSRRPRKHKQGGNY